jgi:hypothetical protein
VGNYAGIIAKVLIPVAVAVIAFWLWWFLYWDPRQKRREWTGELVPRRSGKERSCPICGQVMPEGTRVRSVVYPGKPYSVTDVYGCPSCYPANPLHKRICPVCDKELAREGYLIGRMFERPGRKHVHIMGCTGCQFPRPGNR